ncbi:MAG TPA: ribonuclease H-like domain-containing protein [Planctomycetota bacterium]|nr:ribonuclease H-like domain-containing protein [Planctomycetota bacterium]
MTEDLRSRLRRMLGDKAVPASALPPPREGLPAWLRARMGGRRDASDASASAAPRAGLPGELAEAPGFAVRRETLELDSIHGQWSLAEARDARLDAFALLCGDPALQSLELERALFLDIETTGLSGGAGTHVFLVGLAWLEAGRLQLWQGFLRGPEEEPALLADVAERLRGSSGVVSFFGKSFDRHRLQDKMRVHGLRPPFARLPHLDLYHPCRRLYASALPDGRLATMERALCGFSRARDLPGSQAPAAWFDFLAGRAHRLEQVFEHNRHDVLSLVVLYAHLGRALDEARAHGRGLDLEPALSAARAAALAHLYLRRRDPAAALPWLGRALERHADAGARRALSLARAKCLARTGLAEAALAELTALASGERDAIAARALLETSALLEREGRCEASRDCAELALALGAATLSGTALADHERRARARLRRLARIVDRERCAP